MCDNSRIKEQKVKIVSNDRDYTVPVGEWLVQRKKQDARSEEAHPALSLSPTLTGGLFG
jgi:hypothetical protein